MFLGPEVLPLPRFMEENDRAEAERTCEGVQGPDGDGSDQCGVDLQ